MPTPVCGSFCVALSTGLLLVVMVVFLFSSCVSSCIWFSSCSSSCNELFSFPPMFPLFPFPCSPLPLWLLLFSWLFPSSWLSFPSWLSLPFSFWSPPWLSPSFSPSSIAFSLIRRAISLGLLVRLVGSWLMEASFSVSWFAFSVTSMLSFSCVSIVRVPISILLWWSSCSPNSFLLTTYRWMFPLL